ncbi:hypothetical protein [Niastella populi]|nr:hypothetical protein [Niastella populi]
MPGASIYKLHSEDYLMFALCKTKSGFSVACDPFTRIAKDDRGVDVVVNALKVSLNTDDTKRLPDPQNWKEFEQNFLQKCGLKTLQPLQKAGTLLVEIYREDNYLVFLPTKRGEDANFEHKDRAEAVKVLFTASNKEIMQALEETFSKCE